MLCGHKQSLPTFISSGSAACHVLENDYPLVPRAHGQIGHLLAIWLKCSELITFTPIPSKSVLCLPACRTLHRMWANI